MKILLFLFAALLTGPAAYAQALPDEQVPPLAFVALQQLYPQARGVKWKKVQGWYQARYTQSQTYRLVRFNSNGDVQATGTDIAPGALPAPVRRTLAQYYPRREICQATEITTTRTGSRTYEMGTCESSISSTIVLTADGLKIPRSRRK